MKKHPVRSILALFGLVLAALSSGCGTSLAPPEVTMLSLGSPQWKVLGGTSTLHVKVGNPNPDPLRLEGLRVELAANGQTFARGMVPVDVELPGFGSTDLAVPATMSNLDLLRSLLGIGKAKGIDYRMRSETTFRDAKDRRHTMRDDKTGSLGAHMFQGL